MDSNEYPLHLVERHFLGAAIVKLGRARRGVVGHLRSAQEHVTMATVGTIIGAALGLAIGGAVLGFPAAIASAVLGAIGGAFFGSYL